MDESKEQTTHVGTYANRYKNKSLKKDTKASTPVSIGLGMGVAILMAIFIFAVIQGPMETQINDLNNTEATDASNTVIGFVWIFIILSGVAILVIGAKVIMNLVNQM
jgi:hypothetical protein